MRQPTMTVVEVMGYAYVKRRDGEIICDGRILPGKRLTEIQFSHPDYQKNNRTRQAAMKAFQTAGYR